MTESEFLALEPRERDALVAEKVMGWEIRDEYYSDGEYAGQIVYDQEGKGRGGPGEGCSFSSISAAWQVVEKMREGGCVLMMNAHPDYTWAGFHSPKPPHPAGREVIFCGEGDTVPLTICLAALKAKGVIT